MLKRWILPLAALLIALPGMGQEPLPMPKEEALKYETGLKVPVDLDEQIKLEWLRTKRISQSIPRVTASEFDWRKMGLDIAAENQGSCGSCWNFSGTDTIQSALVRSGTLKKEDTLSKQYIMDCNRNGGCNGDWPSTPIKHAKSTGIPTTAVYGPYQARSSSCKAFDTSRLLKIKDWGYVGSEQGVPPVQAIKDHIAKYGPLAVAVAADNSFNNPGDKVIRGRSNSINHAVILVGWKDDPNMEEGGYWIMRNSWGRSWGMDGYCYIAYGAKSIGYGAIWVDTGLDPVPPTPPVPPVPPGPTPGKGFTGTKTEVWVNGVLVDVVVSKNGDVTGLEESLKTAGLNPKIILHVISLIKNLKAKNWDGVLDDIAAIMGDVLTEKQNKAKDSPSLSESNDYQRMPLGEKENK